MKLVFLYRSRYRFLQGFLLFIVTAAHAQVPPVTIDTVGYGHSVDTLQQVLPVQLPQGGGRKASVLKNGALIVAGVGVWTATFAWVDEPVQRFMFSHRSQAGDKIATVVEPFGRQHYMLPLAVTAAATGMLLKDKNLEKAGILAVGSIMVSAGITEGLKHQFHRHRPNSGDDNHFFDGPSLSPAHTSLPSSHTTTAFAMATSVASVYRYEHPAVPPIAYGVATLVGLSRIHDNAHWTTDVLAGALVGYVSAKGTLYLYDVLDQKLKIRKQKLLITPQPGIRFGGVSALLIF
ncbi:phosphatase PAP2 family protein [Pontibacter sp. Tf4]|uniref:phosphatase PAP2 family protein n=1 Tax=Pontibacter sp. Tf4 TaxID=2761620 RepID=UPI00162403F9|nr:phosphatase PAP2 family protein [Pontibacter sp. Tf4]MBB6611556.1 phosphatase PAP2 family protein [Pontibacter sp. Tf4]